MNAADIIGYTYRGENYTPDAIVAQLTTNPGKAGGVGAVANPEAHLDLLARLAGIDRQDEHSFDSDEFPKVIFADSVEDGETFMDEHGKYVDAYGERVYPEGTTYELECGCLAHKTRMSHFGTALYCEAEQQPYCNFECPHED